MNNVMAFLILAKSSRKVGYQLPIIDSVEDALRIAREARASLANLPERERLNLLSDLDEISRALGARVERLEQDVAATRRQIQQAQQSRRACQSYSRLSGAAVPLKPRRRPRCP